MNLQLTRREFMKISAGAGLTIGIALSVSGCEPGRPILAQDTKGFSPDIWIHIDQDNTITVTIAESEMGQGVFTNLSMMVAEELEADWKQMKAVHAQADPVYGYQSTGGSTSLRSNWKKLRMAGAAAREILLQAASKKWNINTSQCRAEAGYIIRHDTGEQIAFGGLVDYARDIPLPESVTLKSPDDFKIIGTPVARLDTPAKVNGRAAYGSDIVLDGLLTATVVHPPVFGSSAKNIDSSATLKVEGVHKVVPIKEGVAVVASDFWSAKKGADSLNITWDDALNRNISSASIREKLKDALTQDGEIERDDGEAKSIITSSSKTITAEYEMPYQAHAPLEPMTCTAHVHDGKCEVWAPTQAPTKSQQVAAKLTQSKLQNLTHRILKLKNDSVILHTTMLGGGFGRRLQTDFVSEAVQLSKAVNAPVRLIWTREEDIQHDFYRPTSLHKISATLDDKGIPTAWWHSAAGPDLGLSGAKDVPYDIPHVRVQGSRVNIPVPTGPWRSVSHSYNAFVIESFIDELAAVHKHDPLEYRLQLLANKPQYINVLEKAAEKAGWGKPLPDGHYHGLAVYKCFGTYVAQVAEISLEDNGTIKIHQVTAAIDCGLVVNPDTVISQLEGAIAFGLSAALKGQITIKDGRVEQSNFHDFPILRFDEMPNVDVVIVKSKKDSPEGVGEPGVPSIGPAVANALFAATGQRQRSLPLRSLSL